MANPNQPEGYAPPSSAPNVSVRRLQKEKGERLRTEEEMEQIRKEYEKFDAALFFDPRKVPCFQTAFLAGTAIGASAALLQRLYRLKYSSTLPLHEL